MDFELEEIFGPTIDMNKTFHYEEELDLDLNQAEESKVVDTLFDFKCLSLQPQNEKTEMSASRIKPKFSEEKILSEVIQKIHNSSLKACGKCGVIQKSVKLRKHEKRCKPITFNYTSSSSNNFDCLICSRSFAKRSSLAIHMKGASQCNSSKTKIPRPIQCKLFQVKEGF